ncbi:short-chain alcohol dehydrogenase/reductase [Nitzschia inconspicua]|uniref:Short-chain alcohol dehydrogenase/reductase n=1 Tax=Nitzschia inconspicua TaxID=303405 RepID=A0A9K3PE66_9STRA|nr:short-chain alcohol dehydrogenase/reductase [Nitzschia inconspicua]
MSFAAYTIKDSSRPAIALVTGGRSGIGKAIANKIATFPFIENVLIVSRSVKESDLQNSKFVAVAADIGTTEGRQIVIDKVASLTTESGRQLRYLVHSAGTIEPIRLAGQITPEEFRNALNVNLEGPFFLSTALYPFLEAKDDDAAAGRILHVSSGAAHGAPPIGWGVYGITKAAFFQSFKVLSREFEHLGGKVVVGSFKPGVVDTSMQGVIRESPAESMPVVGNFKALKEKVLAQAAEGASTKAMPPPKGALDSPENVAFFAEWLLLGTTDEEFSNLSDPNEYDIRDSSLFPKWIPEENLLND